MKKFFLLTSFAVMAFTGSIVASFEPTLSRVNATPFVGQVQEYNDAGTQGTLDTAFGTSGSLSIDTQLSGGLAKAIQVLSDGTFVVALSKAAVPSVVAKYNAEGTIISSFGSSGVASLGSATLVAQTMMIDSQDRIVVAGGDNTTSGTAGWLKRVSTTGSVVSFPTGTLWQFIGGVAQQTSGKLIAVGSNNTNAQIARYTVGTATTAGILDTTFGTAGKIVFDGTNGLTSTTGLYNIVVDSSDNIYVAYLDGTAAKVAKFNASGSLVTAFDTDGIAAITYLNSATAAQMRMALDAADDLVIGAQVSSDVKITSITSASGSAGTLANFTTPSSTLNALYQVIPTSDGKVLLVGSDTTSPLMAVMRLTSVGALDTSTASFNLPFNTTGYNLFNISTPTVASVLYGASIAPDGQLLAVGYQSTGGGPTVTPYVSRLYNAPFVSAVSQFPGATQQGLFDTSFGESATQSFRGVTMPYNGSFGGSLLQQTRGIVELAAGGFLIGSDGYDGSAANKTMMLTWLTSQGDLDTSFGTGSSGKLTLPNVSTSNETMSALAVGSSGIIYIAGTNATPLPFIRSYSSAGSAITSLDDTGTASVGIAIQGSAGILLFAQDSSTAGHISRYTTSAGALVLDTAGFGSSGKIATGALGLNMGPVYGGGLVNRAQNIIIGYKNSATNAINVAMINKNGTALIPAFGTAGVALNVFGDTTIPASNVRIAFDSDINENIYVAAVLTGGLRYLITRLDASTGAVDMSFNGGSVLNISPETVVTALTLTNLTGVSDGTVMLTGFDTKTNPVMLTLRVASASNVAALDTTFNSQGSIAGVTPIQIEDETANYNARVASSLAIQSHSGSDQGNLVYSSYEQQISTQSTPESFRLFGATGTTQVQRFPAIDQSPGTLDISLDGVGALDIASLTNAGAAKVVYAYSDGNTHEGKLLLGVDSGSSLYIIRVDQVTMALDETFGTDGLYTITGFTGLQNIMVDVDNRIVINGSSVSPAAWAQRIPENGDDVPTVFNMPSDITSANMVYQQESGRYIVAGSTSTVGTLIAFQDVVVSPATGLAVDTSFNPLSTGSVAAGRWNIAGSTALYSLVVNEDDTIYTAYKDTSSGFLTIAQVLANGAGFNTAFNVTGKLATTITPDSTAVVRVVVDSSQSVIVAASCVTGTSLQAFRCNLTGGTSTAFTNGGIVSGTVATISAPVGGSAGIALKALLQDTNGKTILIGSNSAGGNGQMFAARLGTNGQFDATWNPSPTSPDVAGMLTFGSTGNPLTPAITIMNNATINVAGNIMAVGGNGIDPILMAIVGDSFVTGVPQGQFQVAPGILDTTLFETTGAYNLVTAGLVLAGYTPNKVYTYTDGSMLFGASNGTATTLTRVDATFAIDTTFNHGAILSLGSGTATLNDMFVANGQGQDGSIYVTGVDSGVLWAAKVSADGLTITPVVTTEVSAWGAGTAIRVAGNGDIMISSYDNDLNEGVVGAFLANGAALDTSFNDGGIISTGQAFPVQAMTIDNLSRIYIAYKAGVTSLDIVRFTPAGTVDTSFVAVPVSASSSWIATSIKMALDQTYNQLVVAAQDGTDLDNYLTVVRVSTIDGSGAGTDAIDMTNVVLTLSDLYIDSDQEIYIVGTNTTDSKAIVARFVSTSTTEIARDTTYATISDAPATAGIANFTVPGVTSIGAGTLNPDGRTYLVGYGAGTSYMARVFNNNYFTQVSQAASSSILGELDYTYGTNGAATNYADGSLSPDDNQEARAIVPLSKGTDLMTVIGDGVSSWTVRVLSDGTNDSSYGSGEGIAIVQQATGNEVVQGMVFDGSGNSIVFGSNSVAGGYVKSVLPSGAMNTSFNANGSPAGAVYISQLSSINAIAQLSNGNFVYVGYKGSVGKIGMLNSAGIAPLLFNGTGFISLGVNVTSISVDADDNFYVSYATSASSVISAGVAKYNSVGELVSDYGTAGLVSSVITNIDNVANIRLVLDESGKVIVAASGNGDAGSVGLVRLTTSGSIDISFNGGVQLDIPFADDTSAVVTSLVALQNGYTLVAGYQYDSVDANDNDYEFVASVTADGVLDTNFNADGAVPGILTFQVALGEQTGRNVWSMGVQNNGQIILAGSEGPQAGGEIPLTMRVNGYSGIRSVPQFVGAVPAIPSDVNSTFGIAFTMPAISNLVEGGYTAVDSQQRVIVGGRTESPNTFVVARFLTDGTLDTDFGTGGISQTPTLTTLVSGSFITLDGSDNVYIGGITSDSRLIVAKFSSTNGNLATAFNPGAVSPLVPGVAQSLTTAQVVSGGYVAIDYVENVIVGGMTADNKLSVARFTTVGAQDGAFGTGGVAQTGILSTLHSGGYVTTAVAAPELFPDLNDNSVYVGASTYANTLLVVKFNRFGVLDATFGAAGLAESATITNLVDGGAVALDSDRSVVVGGYTAGETFVAAKFLASGELAPEFGTTGIAYSGPLFNINSFGNIAIDSNDNILFGGTSVAYDGVSKSLVAARITVVGRIDDTFGTLGVSTSGTIEGLQNGGFVAVNILNNVFLGGYAGTRLVVAGLLSGFEIFINNPTALPELAKKLFLYGNDRNRFKYFLGLHPFAELITNLEDRETLTTEVGASLDAYAEIGLGTPGFNLLASLLPIWNLELTQLQALLKLEGLDNAQVDDFFSRFRERAAFLQAVLNKYN